MLLCDDDVILTRRCSCYRKAVRCANHPPTETAPLPTGTGTESQVLPDRRSGRQEVSADGQSDAGHEFPLPALGMRGKALG